MKNSTDTCYDIEFLDKTIQEVNLKHGIGVSLYEIQGVLMPFICSQTRKQNKSTLDSKASFGQFSDESID